MCMTGKQTNWKINKDDGHHECDAKTNTWINLNLPFQNYPCIALCQRAAKKWRDIGTRTMMRARYGQTTPLLLPNYEPVLFKLHKPVT